MHFLQAWPQTYWNQNICFSQGSREAEAIGYLCISKEICYTGSCHYRDRQVLRSAKRVSKLETQESWWWSSCPKIGSSRPRKSQCFHLSPKTEECWCFSSQAVREGREFLRPVFLTSLPGGSEALWGPKITDWNFPNLRFLICKIKLIVATSRDCCKYEIRWYMHNA